MACRCGLLLLLGALVPNVVLTAQTRFRDREQCGAYGESDIVVLGRPQAPVVIHISGERVIERARQELARVEADVARTLVLLDPEQRTAQEAALDLRVFEAKNQLSVVVAMYPPPIDLTFFPVQVERVLRGAPSHPFLARLIDRDTRLEPERLYLIRGLRSTDVIPPPETTDVPLSDYVNVLDATLEPTARKAVRFLESTASGVTILGRITMETVGPQLTSDQAHHRALAGIRVRAVGDTWHADALLDADGSFAFEHLPPGRITLHPLLPPGLTLVREVIPSTDLRAGSCVVHELVVQHNGRVRGRITNAHALGSAGITLTLDAGLSPGERPGEVRMASHAARRDTRLRSDGTFEFSGVAPGSYMLLARSSHTPAAKPPFPVTYFPGTQNPASAIRIDVGTATEHDGFDFSLVLPEAEAQPR